MTETVTRSRRPNDYEESFYDGVKGFGERLKELRYEHNINQAGLAKLLDLTRSTVAQWENGNSTPDNSWIYKIAKMFNTDPRVLAFGPYTSEDAARIVLETKQTLIPIIKYGQSIKDIEIVGRWFIPDTTFEGKVDREDMKDLSMVKIQSDSMAPDYKRGDLVAINTNDNKLHPEGDFLHWTGLGASVNYMHIIPGAKSAKSAEIEVRDNTGNAPYVTAAKDLKILGRVVGCWKV